MSIVIKSIVLGSGCFWCTEAVFKIVRGVKSVISGYAGGHTTDPDYETVSNGLTGHAEVVKIDYDPKIVSLEKLLHIFFQTHDPTTLNQQGADIGTQYRSIILYDVDSTKKIAQKVITELNNEKYNNQIVTELVMLKKFYPAENYHQNYFAKNPDSAYCRVVIKPKLDKLKKEEDAKILKT